MTGRSWVWWVVGVAVLLVAASVVVVGPRPGGQAPGQAPPGSTPAAPSAAPARATLDVGLGHTCRVEPDGTVSCWGENWGGQLGIRRSPASTRPVRVAGLEDVAFLSAGRAHTCAVTNAGVVRCWGGNDSGQLGDGTTEASPTPVTVQGLDGPAVAVSAGGGHSCAVTANGEVWCWGSGESGELGDGRGFSEEAPALPHATTPTRVQGLTAPAVEVTTGYSHTCALTAPGGVECWGTNYGGQLGDGVGPAPLTPEDQPVPELRRSSPAPVDGLSSGVVAVASGTTHTCALTASGHVLCWGENDMGQLGVDAPAARGVPGEVPGLPPGIRAITAGTHTCALAADGVVACWGPDDSGQLNGKRNAEEPPAQDGPAPFSARPVTVAGLAAASAVSAGGSSTCATVGGMATCWGGNDRGQLGDGTTLPRGGPVRVATPSVRTLAPRDVTVNVIVVDSALDVTQDVPLDAQAAAQALGRRLTTRDPALLRSVEDAFRSATSGVFRPTVKVVTAAQPLVLPGRSSCLDRFNDERLQAVARPGRVQDVINIIVVKALICSLPGESTWAGYHSWGGMPVVGWLSLSNTEELIHTMIHEYGHSEGLPHAGLAECKNPAALASCTTDEVGDASSVMSYVHSSHMFTMPELHRMGFADQAVVSVLDSASTVFTLGTGGTTPAALVLHDAPGSKGDPVYLSGEPGRLEVRFLKGEDQKSSYGASKSQLSLAVVVWDHPKPRTVVYTGARGTLTYAGPDADGNAVITLKKP